MTDLPRHGVTGMQLTDNEVKLFQNYLLDSESEVAKVHAGDSEDENRDLRDAKIVYIDQQANNLYHILNKIAVSANRHFKYDINGIEKAQIISYEAPSNGYNYHIDIGPDGTAATRKISMTLMLNDAFEGGEICFRSSEEEISRKLQIGEVVLFSSFLSHRVKPVTKGTRHVVVAWFTGPPFR